MLHVDKSRLREGTIDPRVIFCRFAQLTIAKHESMISNAHSIMPSPEKQQHTGAHLKIGCLLFPVDGKNNVKQNRAKISLLFFSY